MKFLRKSCKRLNQPLIFVCSPYRGDVNAHVKCAHRYCRYVVKQGGIPFAPHLLFTVRWKLERQQRKPNEHLIPANRQQEAADQCDIGMKLWKGEAE